MKRLIILTMFMMLGTWLFSQDKMGFGNMPEGVDSAGVGTTTTWRKVSTPPPAGVFTMTTTSTSSAWTVNSIENSGATLHWEVTGAVTYSVDNNKPTFDFSAPGTKYITISSDDNFAGLTSLSCSGNQLTTLDVSGLTALTFFVCYGNKLTTLDVSGLTALKSLSCYGNQLTTLDVSGLTALKLFACYRNQLTTLSINNILDDLISIGNTSGNYLNLSTQTGGGCGDPAKIAALDAIWNTVYVDACH